MRGESERNGMWNLGILSKINVYIRKKYEDFGMEENKYIVKVMDDML